MTLSTPDKSKKSPLTSPNAHFPTSASCGAATANHYPFVFLPPLPRFPSPPSIRSAGWQRAGLISKQKVLSGTSFTATDAALVALTDGAAQKTREKVSRLGSLISRLQRKTPAGLDDGKRTCSRLV